jgi:RND family efflux transporter MFP subunit
MSNDPHNQNPADQGSANKPTHDHESAPEQEIISPRKAVIGVVLVAIVLGLLAGLGIWHRISDDRALAKTTDELAAPTVIVETPKQGSPVDSFLLPGNVTAFVDSPIYARTTGYLTKWYFDIGARVKKGALLAEIASPEVDQQLAQAEADLHTSEANAANSQAQADRYTGLLKSNSVSAYDTENLVSQAKAQAAGVKSAQANVQRLHELQSFEKIYAPFDGVVTARAVDTGQLVDVGTGREMFHMQELNTLRVFANVPQISTSDVKRGQKIDLTFPEHANKTFVGTLVRTADAIDPASRTLLVEVDVDNRSGELLPGSLAQVHFKMPVPHTALIVPASALIFRKEGIRVGTVVNGNTAHLAKVRIGEDDGATVQIVDGLESTDQVIQDPPDSLIDGEKVQIVNPNAQPNTGGK